MSAENVTQDIAVDSPASPPQRSGKRLIGLDAARGLALIGLIAIHIYPSADEETHEPTLAWVLFSGDSAALFALLAGVGLALSSGGPNVHRDRRMTADRVGLVVRAVLIGAVGLAISTITPDDPPAFGILLYYAVFFLLAIPFLHLRPQTLFLSAAGFGLIAPLLMQQLGPVLPGSSASNHTLTTLFTEPAGTVSELLLTGAYPALPYMTYILVGMGLGRIDLRSTRVQAILTGTGAALAVAANGLSRLLLRAFGGYEALLGAADATEESLDESIMFGPDSLDTSWWWLTIATPHTNTPLAIAASLGMGLLVTGLFLLIAARTGRLLTCLAAMGSMTLTLYSAHLVALALEVHYDQPHLWFMIHVGAAAAFAWFWHRSIGRGPLEVVVTRAVKGSHSVLLNGIPGTTDGPPAPTPDGR